MSIPKINLTLLGAQGSGKTAFLLGMYMTLHAGVRGYTMITQDRDKHFDLRDAWKQLRTQGELPAPTGDEPIQHDFVFKHEFDSLLNLDVLDFRGNAAFERASSADARADVARLRQRLAKSDSIYIVLDGEQVGEWINRGCPQENTDWAEQISQCSIHVGDAVDAQRAAGRPGVSLVVLLTKADRFPAITGLSKGEASQRATDHLENLVKSAFYQGATTLVCPVQLGDLGPTPPPTGQAHRIDPASVDPRYMHLPVIFSLMHYLTEQSTLDSVRLGQEENRRAAAQAEMGNLRDAFFGFGSLINGRVLKDLAGQLDASMASSQSISAAMATARERADQLMAELDAVPIIKDGKRL